MPPGRNDPCYCGSGKKYKHCHLKENRERERAEKATQPRTPSAPFTPASSVSDSEFDADHQPEARDPEAERLDQLYEEFEAAEYEEQISILRSAIEEAALDGELAFHFFSELYSHMAERDDREEFAELVALLQSNQPDIYAEENQWFWSWEITNALALDDDEALQRATNQLIQNGGQDLDQFFPAFNCLLYHGRREPLIQALHQQTPQVDLSKFFPGSEYELKRRLGDLIVLHYIETHDQVELLCEENFEPLCVELSTYVDDLDRDGLAEFISWAGGLSSGEWTLDDFSFPARRRDWYDDGDGEEDPAIAHLRHLSYEFLHYARHIENTPLTKADLARRHLVDYILERHWGELQEDETSRGRSRSRSRSRKRHKQRESVGAEVLLFDHKTLDRYLLRFFGFLANGTYEGAAFFELIPTWARFLEVKNLVTEDEAHGALRSLQALSQSMTQIMEKNNSDPALAVNMRAWRDNAEI